MSALRRAATRTLTALGVVALVGGVVLGQVRRGLFDSDAFADRVEQSLSDQRVAGYVAEEITRTVLREKPDLVAVHPVLRSTALAVVSSDAFRSVVHVTARRVHATVVSKGGRDFLLSVPDVDVILRGALESANPTLAARIPPKVSTVIAELGGSPASRLILEFWEAGRHLTWAALAGVLIGLALIAAGIALAPRRSEAFRWLALDLVLAGLFLVLALAVGSAIASSIPVKPLAKQAAAGLFDTFTTGLGRSGLGFAGIGLVFSAAAQSLVGRAWPAEAARAARFWILHPPQAAWQRFLRGTLFLAAGLWTAFEPDRAVTMLAVATGAVLAFLGLQELFGLMLRALPEERDAPGELKGFRPHAVIVTAAGALTLAIAWLSRPSEPAIARVSHGCNGDERLCAARLDEVVFPGTHNSMGSVDVSGWMFPQQERGVAGQLEDGVRAFLIDVYAGIPVSGRVKTELSGEAATMRAMERAVGTEGVQAALRIRERLVGPPEGPRALYLCHGFCEVGALPLVPWLRVLRDFLIANPREVVILVVEDYVPPSELAKAFEESRLRDLAFRGSAQPPWPTLEEMTASDQHVVVFLEMGKPDVDWMHPAFDSIQETPYSFNQPSQFSCAANRGGTRGSLLQINHWIDTPPMPKPSNAAIVNAYDFLLARARQCERERSRRPNIIAVDFYRTGDLFRVVKTIGGLDEAATARAR